MVEPTSRMQADGASHLQELHRQAGNSFALLRSIVRWSAESATSVDSYAWHMEGRIDVIGRILLAVIRDPDARFDLCHLIEEELNDQHASDGDHDWSLDGPPVELDAAAAEVMGLLIHELVTNSIEHGALGMEEGGELHVRWTVDPADGGDDKALRIHWTERGAPARAEREGFGSMVMDGMLRYQLDGSAERELGPDGVRITIRVPMRALLRGGEGPMPG